MKTVLKTLKVNAGDIGAAAAIVTGAFLFLELVITFIMLVLRTNAETSVAMGWIMLPMVAGFVCLFFNAAQVVGTFDLMLRYGVTRKNSILSTVALMLAQSYASFALAFLLGELDRLIAGFWVRTMHLELVELLDGHIPLYILLLLPLVLTVVGLGMGALLHRFGRRAFWVLWGGWMLLMIGQGAIPWDDIIENLGAVSPLFTGLVAGAGSLVIGGLAAWSLMRSTVKN